MSKDKKNTSSTTPTKDNLLTTWLKHLGAYFALMVVAMLYFSPIVFEDMSLSQSDNVQATLIQKEISDYRAIEGREIMWTNNVFGGMPTSLLRNHNINYVETVVTKPIVLFKKFNIWITLFMIMFFAYVGLVLIGAPPLMSIPIAAILGFFTANTLYLEAGHSGKMVVLSTVTAVIGAAIFAYRKNIWLGAAIFAMALSQNLANNHPQISYYMLMAVAIISLGFLVDSIQKKTLPHFGKFTGAMLVASLLALMSNLGLLWPVYEYGQESTRGKTELTSAETKEGLSKDYVFGMSLEKSEIAMLMFPNFHGATQAKNHAVKNGQINRESATGKALSSPAVQQQLRVASQKAGVSNDQQYQQFFSQIIGKYMSQYRGSQSITGGPLYYGAVVCFLFFLALLLIRGHLKWSIIATMSFFVILSWGKFFPIINDLMYNYFPLYSKFRDTKMTLLVGQPLVILAIGYGLTQLSKFDPEQYKNTWSAKLLAKINQEVSAQNYVLLGGAIALGICVISYLYLSMTTLSAPGDKELRVISAKLVNALQADRAALAKADIGRAIGFILVSIIPLVLYTRKVIKLELGVLIVAAIACIDLNMVNKEYLTPDDYTEYDYRTASSKIIKNVPPNSQKINRDKDLSFHVVDYSNGSPSQSAMASGFHKSMGGYFAAKPLLYQEFWYTYQMDNPGVALQNNTNLFDMLNVKYILTPDRKLMDNPTALGNAWFVNKVNVVANADEELQSLNGLNTTQEAVVQERYKDYVQNNGNYAPGDRIFLSKYHPEELTYQSETTESRFAVFSEMYYPPSKGWTVYIDGEKADPFVKTNYVLRGLMIPAGKHEIVMKFEPQSILLGRKVGAIASSIIILLVIFFGYQSIQNKKKEDAVEV
jgi:hypothetical protein